MVLVFISFERGRQLGRLDAHQASRRRFPSGTPLPVITGIFILILIIYLSILAGFWRKEKPFDIIAGFIGY